MLAMLRRNRRRNWVAGGHIAKSRVAENRRLEWGMGAAVERAFKLLEQDRRKVSSSFEKVVTGVPVGTGSCRIRPLKIPHPGKVTEVITELISITESPRRSGTEMTLP